MDILKLFLRLQSIDEDCGDVITDLKAQKLLYYAQGMSLAKLEYPLFEDDFIAWQHGPVIPKLYDQLKNFGNRQIELEDDLKIEQFTKEEQKLLIGVYKTFGQYSAWKLRDMTHNESPWKDVNIGEIITKESIRAFFSERYANT